MGALVLLRTSSNRQLDEEDARRRGISRQIDEQALPSIIGLASRIKGVFEVNRQAKLPIERRMLDCLRAINGEYTPEKIAEIRMTGGSMIYMMLTASKVLAAQSWIHDISFPPSGYRPWKVEPTPKADLPPRVVEAIYMSLMEEAMAAGIDPTSPQFYGKLQLIVTEAKRRINVLAKRAAEGMTAAIDDRFVEGGWYGAYTEIISDFTSYPAAIMKGPVTRRRKSLSWAQMSNGSWVPVVQEVPRLEYERCPPFDIYPAPLQTTMENGDMIYRKRLTVDDILACKGMPGYSDKAIDEIIEHYGNKGLMNWLWGDYERARLEGRENEWLNQSGMIDSANYWGSALGSLLLEWDPKLDVDPRKNYQIEAWMAGPYVFKAVINPDPLGRRPFSKSCWEPIPGSFWGRALPERLADTAEMCNNAARGLANNLGIASGPQMQVYMDRVAEGADVVTQYPWKIWYMISDQSGQNNDAVKWFSPNMHAAELMAVYTHFERIADNVSQVPAYSYGDSRVGGAGRTSSGLAQLTSLTGKGFRRIVKNLDEGVIDGTVTRTWEYEMQFNPDPTIKGDQTPRACGSSSLIQREQQMVRRTEILQATTNPLDAQIMGFEGRAKLLSDVLSSAELEDIVPSREQLELNTAGAPAPAQLLSKQQGSQPAPGGGTVTPHNVDSAGGAPQGVEQRKASLGYQDGGLVE